MTYSNFFTPIWYTPKSEIGVPLPAMFLLKPISYRLFNTISSQNTSIIPDEILLEQCIVESKNVTNVDNYFAQLPRDIQKELIAHIIESFYPDKEFYEKLNISLELFLDPRFSGETWDCKVCQEKGLNKQRNCPLIDSKFHDETWTLQLGDKIVSTCPNIEKDHELITQSLEAYRMLDMGFLPENGSFGDQPVFFCIVAQKVKDKIKYFEQKEYEEQRASLSK